MANRRFRIVAALALGAAAMPAMAARPCRHRHVPAALPRMTTVTVHRGGGGGDAHEAPLYAGGALPAFAGGDADVGPVGYWEANYGREDDAAIFAARYGCARPIWNAALNRYVSPCN